MASTGGYTVRQEMLRLLVQKVTDVDIDQATTTVCGLWGCREAIK
jgi:hypothetical protein